ncbi:OmpW family outer membrane protein [uncultured Microbulbifer sp.]|uniref:OmpW/AlkL family protein n=1 Tax=uncultured Microbulbifer sp. TaxID=348147 RepID=UPI0025FA7C19|nr:OmpW family outer membrane protein [uncultured Microbulbifer sp.]
MRTKSLLLPLAIVSASATAPAFADFNGGDVIVRVGAAFMETDDTSVLADTVLVDVEDPNDPDAVIPVEAGASLDLDDETTWFINGTFFLADHWAVELYHMNSADLDASISTFVITPDAEFRGTDGIGDFETSVTSFYVDWYPVCVESWIQPYVGVGVNYTDIDQDWLRPVFVDESTNYGLLNFGSSFGWTAQVGVDMTFGRESNWLINASAMYIDADPELELGFDAFDLDTGAVDTIRIKDDLEYDSWIFNLGVGYKFSF